MAATSNPAGGAALDAQVVHNVEHAARTRKRFGEWSFVTHAVAAALKGEKVKPRVEVKARFDFLALNPTEDSSVVQVPLADAVSGDPGHRTLGKASAYIPFGYISDSRQRIDIYRKLAQATEKQALEGLRRELRDRFGPLPRAIDLLLQVAELKILASEQGVAAIETKEDKLMLTRNNDYITLAGKFPRLTKQEPKARLNEIRKLLLAL